MARVRSVEKPSEMPTPRRVLRANWLNTASGMNPQKPPRSSPPRRCCSRKSQDGIQGHSLAQSTGVGLDRAVWYALASVFAGDIAWAVLRLRGDAAIACSASSVAGGAGSSRSWRRRLRSRRRSRGHLAPRQLRLESSSTAQMSERAEVCRASSEHARPAVNEASENRARDGILGRLRARPE